MGSTWSRRLEPDRIANAFAVAACLWFAFAAAWGMFELPGAGHSGAGSVGHVASSWPMVKWKIVYPVNEWYSAAAPAKSQYYCHHPFGSFWWSAICLFIFGHHDVVVHLPTVLLSFAIPPLIYGIGRDNWGAIAGAAGACAYVVVPIAVGFANFDNLETIGIFGSLLFFWGQGRYLSYGKRRDLAASLVGCAACCSGDWYGYATVAPLIGWGLLRGFVLPKRASPRVDADRYARWWALSAAVAVGSLVMWVAFIYKADKIGDWLSSGEMRGGDSVPLKTVLEGRTTWIDFSFTPLAIAIGKAAVPVLLARLVVLRRDAEVYALSALAGALVEYVVFKRGADVHIFWPHPFAEYYALAIAQLTALLVGAARILTRALSPPRAAAVALEGAALLLGLAPSLAMAPDAVRALMVWRRTGGRYDEKGGIIRSDEDLLHVIRDVIVPNKKPGWKLEFGPGSGFGWEQSWAFDGEGERAADPRAGLPPGAPNSFWFARASNLGSADATRIASEAHVRAYGDIWVVDQRERAAPIDAIVYEEREPNLLEWLAYGGWEPVRVVGGPDALRTWEWRVHLGQPATLPPEAPDAPATAIDDLRILHNAAVAAGATARARALEDAILKQLDRSPGTAFSDGIRLLGVRLTNGVQPKIEVWFAASGPLPGDAIFHVRSTITGRAPLSLIPPSPTEREMAFPPILPTRLWRPGFFYKIDVVMNHRIGVERYWGAWGGPRRLDGQAQTTLAVVE
jgi:hypothetical protein